LERVYYTGIKSPIGIIWAAATGKGLLRVDFPQPELKFIESIRRRMEAVLVKETGKFHELIRLMRSYFDGERVTFNLPLDLRGTEFKKAIWNSIHRIPYGRLMSYGGLAAAVGRPRAVRAAGNAVGANPLAIIIPCHRVIRSDGSLGGFGGGLNLKRYLLNIEGVLPEKEDEGYPISRSHLRNYLLK